MHRSPKGLSLEAAEGVAAQGFAFLAEEPERLLRFLALTGLEPAEIRAQAQSPQFLAAVLEHLASDESLLLVFAANASVAPETVAAALAQLQAATGRPVPQ